MLLINIGAVVRISSQYMTAYNEIINNNTLFIIKFINIKWPEYSIHIMEFAYCKFWYIFHLSKVQFLNGIMKLYHFLLNLIFEINNDVEHEINVWNNEMLLIVFYNVLLILKVEINTCFATPKLNGDILCLDVNFLRRNHFTKVCCFLDHYIWICW